MPRLIRLLVAATCCLFCLGLTVPSALSSDEEPVAQEASLSQFYGFTGLELFKVNDRAFNLVSGDFDSDGLTDLIMIDNRESSLRYLRQRAKGDPVTVKAGTAANDLVSDSRFDDRKISVDKQLAGLVAADFNGDGRIDVAYVGVPDRVVIRYQPESGKEWNDRWSVRLPDLQPATWMITSGDLNGDRRADIVVLGKAITWVLYQNEDGEMSSPTRVMNTSPQLSMIQAADIDGDGRDDLCYLASDGSERILCARLQSNEGQIGPELQFALNKPRSVTLADVDGAVGKEVLTVDSRTGRLVVSKLKRGEKEPGRLAARLVQYGFGEQDSSKDRAIAVGDIDNDKLTDVVITDPDQAQVMVFRQDAGEGLKGAATYPSLLGATDVCITPGADGVATVLLMSEKERVVAASRYEGARLTFPQPVISPPDDWELEFVETLSMSDASAQVIVGMKTGSGRSAKLRVARFVANESGEFVEQDGGSPLELEDAVGSRNTDALPFDVDQDGDEDLLILPGGGSTAQKQLLLAGEDGKLTKVDVTSGIDLGEFEAGATFVDAGRIMVARDSFARAISLKDNTWVVDDQYNARESKAKIDGVARLQVDGEGSAEIVLIDSGVSKLRVLREEEGLFQPWKEAELGTLRFRSAHVADFDGDQRDDLMLFGSSRLAILYANRSDPELDELATFESELDDVFPADAVVGDVNGDGDVDVALVDTRSHRIQLLRYRSDLGLQDAINFTVFEEKRLVSNSSAEGTEPREGMIRDVTGDGRADLILLCHDRILLYPQDVGPQEDAATAETAEQ